MAIGSKISPPIPNRRRCLAKATLGTKRICPSCGARFYDLDRNPITCPKCASEYAPEDFMKTRRSRATSAAAAAKGKGKPPKPDPKAPVEDGEAAVEDGDEEDEDVMEDTSELGEDEDVAEVVEGVEEEEER